MVRCSVISMVRSTQTAQNIQFSTPFFVQCLVFTMARCWVITMERCSVITMARYLWAAQSSVPENSSADQMHWRMSWGNTTLQSPWEISYLHAEWSEGTLQYIPWEKFLTSILRLKMKLKNKFSTSRALWKKSWLCRQIWTMMSSQLQVHWWFSLQALLQKRSRAGVLSQKHTQSKSLGPYPESLVTFGDRGKTKRKTDNLGVWWNSWFCWRND